MAWWYLVKHRGNFTLPWCVCIASDLRCHSACVQSFNSVLFVGGVESNPMRHLDVLLWWWV